MFLWEPHYVDMDELEVTLNSSVPWVMGFKTYSTTLGWIEVLKKG